MIVGDIGPPSKNPPFLLIGFKISTNLSNFRESMNRVKQNFKKVLYVSNPTPGTAQDPSPGYFVIRSSLSPWAFCSGKIRMDKYKASNGSRNS